jgi:hypothetical protein
MNRLMLQSARWYANGDIMHTLPWTPRPTAADCIQLIVSLGAVACLLLNGMHGTVYISGYRAPCTPILHISTNHIDKDTACKLSKLHMAGLTPAIRPCHNDDYCQSFIFTALHFT